MCIYCPLQESEAIESNFRVDTIPAENRKLYRRPTLFNRISVLLVVGWVVIVMFIAESTHPAPVSKTVSIESFIETLVK